MRSDEPPTAKQGAAYVFDSARLLPGDIILSTVPADLLSITIRAATLSAFSHAAICSQPGLLVQARGPGVARVNVDRLAVRELCNVRILRLRGDSVANAAEIAAKAGEFAEAAVLSKYWHWGAATALVKVIPVEARSEFFCSHLVAEVYRKAGVELLPGRDPTKTVPGALVDADCLADVTTEVTRLENRHPFTAWETIEDGLTPSMHDAEVAICRRIVDRMKQYFVGGGVPVPATFPDLVVRFCALAEQQRKAIDEPFAECLQVEGYLGLVQRFTNEFSASYYHDRRVQFGLETGQITAEEAPTKLHSWHSLLEGYREDFGVDAPLAMASRKAYEASGLRTLELLSELCADLLYTRTRIAAALERSIALLEQWQFPPPA